MSRSLKKGPFVQPVLLKRVNTLTGIRRSRKPPTGSPIKADNHSNFDIKKEGVPQRSFSLHYGTPSFVWLSLKSIRFIILTLCMFLYRSFMYCTPYIYCTLLQFTPADVYCKLLWR